MSNQQSDSDELLAEGWTAYSVIALSFADDRNACNALTELEKLDSQHWVGIQEAVVVVRGEDGQIVERDRVESVESILLPEPNGGGLTRQLIRIIGEPHGMLIGPASELALGSPSDSADISETASALAAISSTVQVGRTSLLAVVTEQSPEVIDAAVAKLGGTVVRRSVDAVKAEIAAAENAQRKAKWEARKALAGTHREHVKAAVDAKLDELESKPTRVRRPMRKPSSG